MKSSNQQESDGQLLLVYSYSFFFLFFSLSLSLKITSFVLVQYTDQGTNKGH